MTDLVQMGSLAQSVYKAKYSMDGKERWEDTARRVVDAVMGPRLPELVEDVYRLIVERKFIPGGRYLYASGRPLHQTQNCLLLRAEDSREGWASLMQRVTSGLMTGAGIGIDYSDVRPSGAVIRGSGGESTGPLALMQMVNETGRHIRQGGSRRSALWAGLNWKHKDIHKFVEAKDWPEHIAKQKEIDFDSYAPLDGTNISVLLDDEFFEAIHDEGHELNEWANSVYWRTVEKMLSTGEPGFSVDVGPNAGETLRNAPVSGNTQVLTDKGYRTVLDITDMPSTVWTGKQWVDDVVFSKTADNVPVVRVDMTGGRSIVADPSHEFFVERYKGAGKNRKLVSVDKVPAEELKEGDQLHVSLPQSPVTPMDKASYTLGFLYGDGSFRNGRAETTLCVPEKKALLCNLVGYDKFTEKDSRGYSRVYWHSGFDGHTKDRLPDDVGDVASFVAGLFDADGNWNASQRAIRLASVHEGFLRGVARLLESLGILAYVSKAGHSTYGKSQTYQLTIAADYRIKFSEIIPTRRVVPNLENYKPYRASAVKVLSVKPAGSEDVYCADVKADEHSFQAEGVIISNCTEVTSSDDNDICNLGSLNMARFDDVGEWADAVQFATAFLLCGSIYSLVPFPEVAETREKNRRLGLGIMGLAEWLAVRGYRYEPNKELEMWMKFYVSGSDYAAKAGAKALGISRPVKVRAIAPAGTISIVAETTSGIEPIFAVAYKRRYQKDNAWHYQYVIDAAAERLAARGIDPDTIETAATLADDPERRIAMQAFIQRYVDHGISSTINLPSFAEQSFSVDTFGNMLLNYLPEIRGITTYPDGSRGGQPLTAVSYAEAKASEGVEYEEVGNESACVGGVCGI